jgi:orotate phosphoribosyltransferase/AMMECR1 domain-containing protein
MKDLQPSIREATSLKYFNRKASTASTSQLERLKTLIQKNTIVYSDNTQKIIDNDGNEIPWIFYNWGISLTSFGARLTARCILDKLKSFKSKQLVSYGMTSVPIVASCVSLSNDLYTGLAIRQTREAHGTCQQIEGRGDKSKPVVIIDDAISSGNSLFKAASILESEGYTVEGSVCLVDFPWRGGTQWAGSIGYRIETLFDAWVDLGVPMEEFIPHHQKILPGWDAKHRTPDHLSPADAARMAIEHYLKTGSLPLPPASFDTGYDGRGGIFVSLRDSKTNHRLARNGFYIMDPADSNQYRDVSLAAYQTIAGMTKTIANYGMDNIKVAVALMSRQEPIKPRQLDFETYGIAIQSDVRSVRFGGALPNTQSFTSEIEQYLHARYTNTHLTRVEPHTIYRHKVIKSVEQDKEWPPFGHSFSGDHFSESGIDRQNTGQILTQFVHAILGCLIKGTDPVIQRLDETLVPFPICGAAVSIYHSGMIGCWTSFTGNLQTDLHEATIKAWNDPRYKKGRGEVRLQDTKIVVALLHDKQSMGKVDLLHAANKLRLGKDTLEVRKGDQWGVILAHIPSQYGWTKEKMARALVQKVGISPDHCSWSTYDTTTWLLERNNTWCIKHGNVAHREKPVTYESIVENVKALSDHITHQIRLSPLPDYGFWPAQNEKEPNGTATRLILGLSALYDAGQFLNKALYKNKAKAGLAYCCKFIHKTSEGIKLYVPGQEESFGSECLLLLALAKPGRLALASAKALGILLEQMESFLHPDGSISGLAPGKQIGTDHDIFPGAVLLTAAEYCSQAKDNHLLKHVEKHFRWYQRRFRLLHPWGMVWWQMQAWSSIYNLTGIKRYADFVFEIADWALDRQLDLNGAFLVDTVKYGPGFHSACVMEGVADAWSLALQLGDRKRSVLLENSWKKGMEFMNGLMVREEDTYFMQAPSAAIGGVRESLVSNYLRIDFAGHHLTACTKGLKNMK